MLPAIHKETFMLAQYTSRVGADKYRAAALVAGAAIAAYAKLPPGVASHDRW